MAEGSVLDGRRRCWRAFEGCHRARLVEAVVEERVEAVVEGVVEELVERDDIMSTWEPTPASRCRDDRAQGRVRTGAISVGRRAPGAPE